MLSRWDQGVLAQAYGLAQHEVTADAAMIAHWRAPMDDLLAVVRERHDFSAAAAYRYLRFVVPFSANSHSERCGLTVPSRHTTVLLMVWPLQEDRRQGMWVR